MEKPSLLSPKERTILWVYFLSAMGVLGLYLLLGVVRDGLPMAPPADNAELAVLAPLSGAQKDLGYALLNVAGQAVAARPANLNLGNLQVTVVGYDTHGTADGAARGAQRAARNPATVAIIGPPDARQALAAAETLQEEDLALLTPASTAAVLPVGRMPGLFRLPAPDNIQGRAMVNFLLTQGWQNVFLIAEPYTYVQGVLDAFFAAAGEQVRLVGKINLGEEQLPADLAQRITDSQAEAVVYVGGPENALAVIRSMNAASLKVPVVSSDGINDPKVVEAATAGMPVYFTSPILNLPAFADQQTLAAYRGALATFAEAPYAYETTQATWMVLGALAQRSSALSPRAVVKRALEFTSLRGLNDETNTLVGGQRRPLQVYIYQVSAEAKHWSQNPLVYVHQER